MSDVPAIPIHPPVRGEWVALNTPAERIPSHGTDFFGQRFAFDLVRYDASARSFSRRPLWQQFLGVVGAEQFHCWNEPVFACFDGEVVAAADDWPDRMRVNSLWQAVRAHWLTGDPGDHDLRPLLGNHVILAGAPGFALYAHLRCGHVSTAVGQRVQRGQCLGHVGNSGNSTQPHLHFHVMDKPSPRGAAGVLCSFLDCDSADLAADPATGLVPGLMRPFVARVS